MCRPSGFSLLLEPRRCVTHLCWAVTKRDTQKRAFSWSRASRTLLAGAVSGAASKTATAPIETVRIKLSAFCQPGEREQLVSSPRLTHALAVANGGQLVDVVRKTFDAGGVAAFWKVSRLV